MWIDMLLGRRKEGQSVADKPRSRLGAPIQYNPRLVPELLQEHETALGLLEQIRQANAAGDSSRTGVLLEQFGSLLTAHLLKEDFRLYTYLEHSLAGDPATQGRVRGLREEMDAIGKAALAFLAQYRNIAVLPALPDQFPGDLADLENILRERMEREKRTLYPMYLPAY